MIDIPKLSKKCFLWLESDYGFALSVISFNETNYNNKQILLKITYYRRDGCSIIVEKMTGAREAFGLQGLIAALKTYHGTYYKDSDVELLSDENYIQSELCKAAKFLQVKGRAILTGDQELFVELNKLRFWHIGKWVNRWGTTIKMSKEEINDNRMLVPRIENLLTEKGDRFIF